MTDARMEDARMRRATHGTLAPPPRNPGEKRGEWATACERIAKMGLAQGTRRSPRTIRSSPGGAAECSPRREPGVPCDRKGPAPEGRKNEPRIPRRLFLRP